MLLLRQLATVTLSALTPTTTPPPNALTQAQQPQQQVIMVEKQALTDQITTAAGKTVTLVAVNNYNNATTSNNNDNSARNNTTSSSAADSSNQFSAHNSNTNSNSSSIENHVQALSMLWGEMDRYKNDLSTWLAFNRLYLAGAAGVGSYLGANGYLLLTYYSITHGTWGNWKKHLSNKEMQEILLHDRTKKELSDGLIKDIFKHHINPLEPTNGIKLMIDFIQAIDQEIARNSRFILISQILTKSRLSYLFATNEQKLKQAKRCRLRARLVKNIFLAWLASCNINNLFDSSSKAQLRRINGTLIDLAKKA